jgi:hypothetical protein
MSSYSVALANEEPSSVLFTDWEASTERKTGGFEFISVSIIKAVTEDNNSEGSE